MKKKVLFVAMALGAIIGVKAQPTLTLADAPQIGDVFINAHDTISVLSPNVNRGENVTWDYSNLQASYIDTTTVVDPATVDVNDSFSDATFAQISKNDTSFYKTSSDKIELIGFMMQGFSARFSDPLTALISPFTYGDNFTDAGEMTLTAPFDTNVNGLQIDSVRISMTIDTKDTAIGYGTLLIPAAEYSNVLLNKRDATHHDVIDVYVSTYSLGWQNVQDTTYTDINYAFYTNGYGDLLLGFTVDGNNDVKSITYKYDETSSIEETTTPNIKIYPNPTTDKIFVETQAPAKQINIYNVDGKNVKNIKKNTKKLNIDVSNLPEGSYVITIKTTKGTITKQFIKN